MVRVYIWSCWVSASVCEKGFSISGLGTSEELMWVRSLEWVKSSSERSGRVYIVKDY